MTVQTERWRRRSSELAWTMSEVKLTQPGVGLGWGTTGRDDIERQLWCAPARARGGNLKLERFVISTPHINII